MIKQKIRPMGARVLVRVQANDEKTAGGIFIPEAARQRPYIGEVVAYGDEASFYDGDRVLFPRHAGTAVQVDGKEYLFLNKDDILGVIDEVPGESA